MIADPKIAKNKVEAFNDQFENLGYGEGIPSFSYLC